MSIMAHSTQLVTHWRLDNSLKLVMGLVIFIIVGLARTSEGLRMCYRCDTMTSGLDCVHNPSNVTDGEVSCKGYCMIKRKEYVYMHEDSSLISLERTCEKNPHVVDGVVVESYFKIYFRSCKSYLCNVGSGIQSLREIPVDPAWDLYPDEDLETSNAFSNPTTHYLMLLLSLSSFVIVRHYMCT